MQYRISCTILPASDSDFTRLLGTYGGRKIRVNRGPRPKDATGDMERIRTKQWDTKRGNNAEILPSTYTIPEALLIGPIILASSNQCTSSDSRGIPNDDEVC